MLAAVSVFAASVDCGGGHDARARDEAVRRAEQIASLTRATGPLSDTAFRAVIFAPAAPAVMRAGQRETVRVRVKNDSADDWPARGRPEDGFFQVNLGNLWRDTTGRVVDDTGYVRSGLPVDLKSGEEVELPLVVVAPKTPGDYTLEIDLVQEMVAWFHEKGSPIFKTKVRVE